MNRDQALALLPAAYATALRLRGTGADHAAIATRLDLPVEAVPALLTIADAKLAALLHGEAEDSPAT